MAKIDIDINLVEENIKDLNTTIDKYSNIIESFYNRVDNMQNNGEWIGVSASKYIVSLNNKKSQYLKVASILKSYSDALKNYCDEVRYSNEKNKL